MLCSGCVMPAYKYGRLKNSFHPAEDPAPNLVTFDPPHPKLDHLEKALFRPVERLANVLGTGHPDNRSRELRMQESLDTTLAYLT